MTLLALTALAAMSTSAPGDMDRLEFLAGSWDATFETFAGAWGDAAGSSPGSVVGQWGPGRAWLDVEARTSIGDAPYAVRVLVYAAPGDSYRAFVVNTFGGGVSYEGRFVDERTLVFTTRIGAHIQRVTYENAGAAGVRFRVEESSDDGTTFAQHSAASWTKAASIGRVAHFELIANQPERAASFYRDAFGWTVREAPGAAEYWLVETGTGVPGIDGGIMRRQSEGERATSVVYVQSIDVAQARIEAHGGRLLLRKQAIPGAGWQAYFADPEGNVLGLFQVDPGAR